MVCLQLYVGNLDDSIKLHLFPRTLTSNATKWLNELLTSSFHEFGSLAMAFLTHFQLPIRYEIDPNLIASKHHHSHLIPYP